MSFDAEIEGLLAREGGYVNHPADRGGPTNFGITAMVARETGYVGAMRDLPREVAVRIYKIHYWDALQLDEIGIRLPQTAGRLFDLAVNMGPARAVKILQRALNFFRGPVAVDGKIGDQTMMALSLLLRQRGAATDKVLARAINGLAVARYVEIVEANATQRAFAWGWLANRVTG